MSGHAKFDYRCPRCLRDQRDRDGLEKHLMRKHQCVIGGHKEELKCSHCHIAVKNKQNWEQHLRSDRHRAAVATKFADMGDLIDYIKSDSSFLMRHEVGTVLDVIGDLDDPQKTVYRMFEQLHITTNRNLAMLTEDSHFVLVVHQRAWSSEESSFILKVLAVCAQMVKTFFVVRKSVRHSIRRMTLHRLEEYIDTLREELLGDHLSADTVSLVNSVKARLVQATLNRDTE